MRLCVMVSLLFLLIGCANGGSAPGLPLYFSYVTNSGDNTVSAYSMNAKTGILTEINGSPFNTGVFPGWIAIDATNRFAYVANQTSNNISGYSIDATTGALTPLTNSPYGAGTFPRSLAIDYTGKYLYAANKTSNTISGYSIDSSTGVLTRLPGSPFPCLGTTPYYSAADPTAPFIFISDFGTNNLSVFKINSDGSISEPFIPFTVGTSPKGVVVDATGRFVYVTNSVSGSISGFSINSTTGFLSAMPSTFTTSTANPGAGVISPNGKFMYVNATLDITIYTINSSTGYLSQIQGSPFTQTVSPGFTFDPDGNFMILIDLVHTMSEAFINPITGVITPNLAFAIQTGTTPQNQVVIKIPQPRSP